MDLMRNHRIWLAVAMVWAFAEATFFFIVPDVILTVAVVAFGFARAMRIAVNAAGAAVAGGVIMWAWGETDIEAARQFLLTIPLVGDDLLVRVKGEMAGVWPLNLTIGAITGAPFKIYAVEAGAGNIHAALFAIIGFFARLARFALAIGLTALGAAALKSLGWQRIMPFGVAAVWLAIYGVYIFMRMSA